MHEQFVKATLADVISRLPEKEKIVISLFYFEELSLTQIAEILGLSTSRISQLHSKAIMRLKGSKQACGFCKKRVKKLSGREKYDG